jgi:Xaa-Pro aminopeptidase
MFADNDWLVRDGQTIIFEAWGTWSNYAFDVSRTAHVGEPSAEYRRLCAEIARGQEEAVKSLRPGRSTAQIMAEMNRIAVSLDVPTPKKTLVFLHSIGLDIIELPTRYPALGRGRDFELEPNTVVNFEFLYFGHSVAPFHLESSYLITGSGAECLHTLPQELLVVG